MSNNYFGAMTPITTFNQNAAMAAIPGGQSTLRPEELNLIRKSGNALYQITDIDVATAICNHRDPNNGNAWTLSNVGSDPTRFKCSICGTEFNLIDLTADNLNELVETNRNVFNSLATKWVGAPVDFLRELQTCMVFIEKLPQCWRQMDAQWSSIANASNGAFVQQSMPGPMAGYQYGLGNANQMMPNVMNSYSAPQMAQYGYGGGYNPYGGMMMPQQGMYNPSMNNPTVLVPGVGVPQQPQFSQPMPTGGLMMPGGNPMVANPGQQVPQLVPNPVQTGGSPVTSPFQLAGAAANPAQPTTPQMTLPAPGVGAPGMPPAPGMAPVPGQQSTTIKL